MNLSKEYLKMNEATDLQRKQDKIKTKMTEQLDAVTKRIDMMTENEMKIFTLNGKDYFDVSKFRTEFKKLIDSAIPYDKLPSRLK